MDCSIKPVQKTQKLEEEFKSIFLEVAKENLGNTLNIDLSRTLLQADFDGTPAGWAEFATSYGPLYLATLVVRKQYRERGIGRQLLNRVIQIGREMKCGFIYLETASFQAPEFYKKFGFNVDFIRSGFCNNSVVYYMSKKL